jgi:hypothetical protein
MEDLQPDEEIFSCAPSMLRSASDGDAVDVKKMQANLFHQEASSGKK